jgi:hypothetical protein
MDTLCQKATVWGKFQRFFYYPDNDDVEMMVLFMMLMPDDHWLINVYSLT